MKLTYFRQAWQLLKQNKLFSAIYIIGTALAIASTTIFAIIYYVRLAPVYPEYKRGQIYSISSFTYTEADNPNSRMLAPSFSKNLLNNLFYNLKNAETVSGYINYPGLSLIQQPGQEKYYEIKSIGSDMDYFKIFDFEFVAGAPFSQADFDSGVRKLVISDQVAKRLFGSPDDAIGKTVALNFSDFEICGVFREGSAINELSFVQAINPYTIDNGLSRDHHDLSGWYSALFLTDTPDKVNDEIDAFCRRYSASHDGVEIDFMGQPFSSIDRAFSQSIHEKDDMDFPAVIRFNLLILLTLLIVPALNLSGMIAGRMDERNSELSIRKSFGATRGKLLSQVLWENIILTLIGGILGLAMTWIVLSTDAISAFANIGAGHQYLYNAIDIRLTPDMLFAPAIFIFAFIVCVVLNLMSALLPAWNALRKPIVKSLK